MLLRKDCGEGRALVFLPEATARATSPAMGALSTRMFFSPRFSAHSFAGLRQIRYWSIRAGTAI